MEKNEVDLEVLFKNLRKVSYQKVPKGLENKIFCDAKTEFQKRTRAIKTILESCLRQVSKLGPQAVLTCLVQDSRTNCN